MRSVEEMKKRLNILSKNEQLHIDEDCNLFEVAFEKLTDEQFHEFNTNSTDKKNNLKVIDGNKKSKERKEKSEYDKKSNPFFDEEGKFKHAEHAESVMNILNGVYDGQFLWRYENGFYRNDGETHFRVIGQQLLEKYSQKNLINESLYYAQNARRLVGNATMNPPCSLVNVMNGMLDPSDGQIYPHMPEFLSTIQLPVEYDPEANDPIIHNFVASVLPEDSHNAFYEMIGYILSNDLHLEKAFMFTGKGGNGKSVAIEMVSALLGKENISNVSLQDLDHRFRLGGIDGKLLNAFSDLPQKPIEDTGNFKAIVSHENITIEHKNKDPKKIKPTCKLLFSTNHMVVTPDMSDGYFRRWLLFEFKNTFDNEKRDIDLIHKLTTPKALSTLLNYAIEGLKRLNANRRFSESKSCIEAIEKYRMNCDSVLQFVDDKCSLGDDFFLPTKKLYQYYEMFCEEWGIRNKLGKKSFNQRIVDRFGLEHKDKFINKKGTDCWIGIKMNDDLFEIF